MNRHCVLSVRTCKGVDRGADWWLLIMRLLVNVCVCGVCKRVARQGEAIQTTIGTAGFNSMAEVHNSIIGT